MSTYIVCLRCCVKGGLGLLTVLFCDIPEVLGLVVDNILQWQTIRFTIHFWSRLWLDNGKTSISY